MQNQFRYKFLKWNVGYFEKIFIMTSQLSVSQSVNSCVTAFAEVEAKLNKVTEKVDESISKVDVNSANTEPSKLCQEILKRLQMLQLCITLLLISPVVKSSPRAK